ncbi:MAG: EamA family transporter [Oscillospiraceae bacterium]|nr:EamA family transporter [Oscillospiraceae bacterium]
MKTKTLRGVLLALMAGTCWGFSGTVGQYLFTNFGVDSGWLTVVRMTTSGLILLGIVLASAPAQLKTVWQNQRDSLHLILFSVAGLMAVQYTYMQAIFYSNSGTATALQYLGESFILIYVCLAGRRLPHRPEVLGLVLALGGIFLIATHGNLSNIVLSPQGLFWGLAAAFALMSYTLMPGGLIRKYGSRTVTGYGMLIGGVVLGLVLRPWGSAPALVLPVVLGMAAIILIGTVFAFTAYLKSIADLGSVKAGLLASVETVSAPVISFLWLGTRFTPADCLGFACVLAMVVLLALPELRAQRMAAKK